MVRISGDGPGRGAIGMFPELPAMSRTRLNLHGPSSAADSGASTRSKYNARQQQSVSHAASATHAGFPHFGPPSLARGASHVRRLAGHAKLIRDWVEEKQPCQRDRRALRSALAAAIVTRNGSGML